MTERYLDSRDFLWNVGIFFCKASTLIEVFELFKRRYDKTDM